MNTHSPVFENALTSFLFVKWPLEMGCQISIRWVRIDHCLVGPGVYTEKNKRFDLDLPQRPLGCVPAKSVPF